VALSLEDARAQLDEGERDSQLTQDGDVLDTWFSSALIPIVLAGWPEREVGGDVLDLMETGHDIIGFWVARMLMVCQR
jgi:valyl-tRNA synthetase